MSKSLAASAQRRKITSADDAMQLMTDAMAATEAALNKLVKQDQAQTFADLGELHDYDQRLETVLDKLQALCSKHSDAIRRMAT